MNHHRDSSDASSRRLNCNSTTEFLIFAAQEGSASIEARYEDETIWLTQRLAAEPLGTTQINVTRHLRNIYNSGELEESATCKDFLQLRQEGQRQVRRQATHYNLDAIISVGYRVNTVRATRFRQWATSVLHDFAIRGYLIDRRHMGTAPSSARTTSSTCSIRPVRSACPSAASTRKLPTSTPPVSTATRTFPPSSASSSPSRTSSTTLSTTALPPDPRQHGLEVFKTQSDKYALSEFEKFHIIQYRHYVSDLDRLEEQANMKERRK